MKKSNYSNPFLQAEKISLPRDLKAQKPERAVISHAAETSGFPASAGSRITKCSDCKNRDFVPVCDNVIRGHLLGSEPQKQSSRDFTIGVYPILKNETCKFLAVDFDKESWTKDAVAFMETCEKFSIHSALERS
jgi:hypothetical protein